MRFLVDANLSPRLASHLRQLDHDVVHVADIDMLTASDTRILDTAEQERRVVVTADTDFATILALNQAARPLGRPVAGCLRADLRRSRRSHLGQLAFRHYSAGHRSHCHDHTNACASPGSSRPLIWARRVHAVRTLRSTPAHITPDLER